MGSRYGRTEGMVEMLGITSDNDAKARQGGGSHYKDFVIQPAEFIHYNGIGFLEGNVIKYVCRYKAKSGRQDLEKAIHYLQLLLELEYEVDNG